MLPYTNCFSSGRSVSVLTHPSHGTDSMSRLLDLAYLLGLLLASPYLLYRMLTSGRYRRAPFARSLGAADLPPAQGNRPRAWFHGVSVGEIHLLRQVVAGF